MLNGKLSKRNFPPHFSWSQEFSPQGFVPKNSVQVEGETIQPTPSPGTWISLTHRFTTSGTVACLQLQTFGLDFQWDIWMLFLVFFGRFLVKDDGIDTPNKKNKRILSGVFNLTKQKLRKLEDFPHLGVLEANQFFEVILLFQGVEELSNLLPRAVCL